jgi:hypothetical protein
VTERNEAFSRHGRRSHFSPHCGILVGLALDQVSVDLKQGSRYDLLAAMLKNDERVWAFQADYLPQSEFVMLNKAALGKLFLAHSNVFLLTFSMLACHRL